MRIDAAHLLNMPPMRLKTLCALICREDNDEVCLLTQAQGKEIRYPSIGSDGRVYDMIALRTWLSTGAQHVIPGCPIHYVNVRIWTLTTAIRAIRAIWRRIIPIKKVKRQPLHARVLAYHISRVRAPPQRGQPIRHDAQRSAFTRL